MTSMNTHVKNPYGKVYPKWATDAMDAVLKLEGPARWRASAAIWLNKNEIQDSGLTARQEYMSVVNDLKQKRASLKSKFGEIQTSTAGTVSNADSLREQLEMPAGMYGMIKMFDRLAFDKSNPDAKRNLNKLRLEFKELSVAESF